MSESNLALLSQLGQLKFEPFDKVGPATSLHFLYTRWSKYFRYSIVLFFKFFINSWSKLEDNK